MKRKRAWELGSLGAWELGSLGAWIAKSSNCRTSAAFTETRRTGPRATSTEVRYCSQNPIVNLSFAVF